MKFRTCRVCSGVFPTERAHATYCSVSCYHTYRHWESKSLGAIQEKIEDLEYYINKLRGIHRIISNRFGGGDHKPFSEASMVSSTYFTPRVTFV